MINAEELPDGGGNSASITGAAATAGPVARVGVVIHSEFPPLSGG